MEQQERNEPEAVVEGVEDLELQDQADDVQGGSGGGSTNPPKGGGPPGPPPQGI